MSERPDKTEASEVDYSKPPPIQPPLMRGDPAPWFSARSDTNPSFKFSSLGGRHVVLSFLHSFNRPESAAAHRAFLQETERFAPFTTGMLLVTGDPADETAKVPSSVSGRRYLFDDGQRLAKLYGVEAPPTLTTFILDERLRVAAVVKTRDAADHVRAVLSAFDQLPKIPPPQTAILQAPVIIVPFVFETELCRTLIAGYEKHGGEDSGFMVEREGLTVLEHDYQHKRRADWNMQEANLIQACHARIQRRLVPEILRAFQFKASRIERNLVACYTAEDRGHFNRHRDNTTKGTAHRRFAVSINLNTEEYDGGDLVFPEFGQAHFRPPTGGACVFSCSLLHEATTVTRGRRFVFVPFLYDEHAAGVRQQNQQFIAG